MPPTDHVAPPANAKKDRIKKEKGREKKSFPSLRANHAPQMRICSDEFLIEDLQSKVLLSATAGLRWDRLALRPCARFLQSALSYGGGR